MNELGRIVSDRKRLAALIILPFICLFLFFSELVQGDLATGIEKLTASAREYRDEIEQYKDEEPEVTDAALEEKYRFEPTPNPYTEAKHIADYEAYLSGVADQADKLSRSSLFGGNKDGFTYRNIMKTAEDFKKLEGIEIRFGSNRAVEEWLSFKTSDLIFAFGILIVVLSFFDERGKSVCAIVRSCPGGRGGLTAQRLFSLAFFSALFTAAFYAVPLAASFGIFGGEDDLGRAVQSLESFKTCTLSVSIGEWILIYLGIRVATGLLIGLVFWFVLSFLEHQELKWLVLIGLAAAEFAAYTLIAPQMSVSIFRYVNLFSYIHAAELFRSYVNLNFFGYPVNVLIFMSALLPALIALFACAVTAVQLKRYPYGNRNVLSGVIRIWNTACDKIRRRLTIFPAELYKALILGGTVIFLAAGAWIGSGLQYRTYLYTEPKGYVYTQYLNEAKGQIDDSTEEYIVRARYELELRPELAEAGGFSDALQGLEREIAARKTAGEAGGFDPWLLDQTDVNSIIGEKAYPLHRYNALIALGMLILSISPVFTFEKRSGTEKLLLSLPRGRKKLFFRKYAVVLLECVFLWVVIYARQWRNTVEFIGPELLAAPARNADSLSAVSPHVTLGGFLLITYLLRLAAMIISSHIVIWISLRFRDWEKAALVSAAALLLPALLYYLGQSWAGVISVLPYLSAVDLVSNWRPEESFGLAAWLVMASASVISSAKKWAAPRG